MNEERRQILQMLAEGKINAEEAERLLSAIEGSGTGSDSAAAPVRRPGGKPKYLRVLVDAEDHHTGKPVKVNIRVPVQLMRAGVRLSALIPSPARDQVNKALQEQGIPVDVGQLKPDNLEELLDHLNDLTVDVDQEKAKVRVFCESE
jgi:hypothetical protein